MVRSENTQEYMELAAYVVKKAREMGAGQSEAFLINSRELSVDVREGQVETMKLAEDRGLGIRIFKEGRIGFAFTSDLDKQAVNDIIAQALKNSDKTTADEFNSLPETAGNYPQLDLFDPAIHQVPVEDKIALAKHIEEIAKNYDRRITNTERAAYFDVEYAVTLANSLGVAATYKGSYCGAYMDVVAEENGDSQTGFGLQFVLKYRDLDPKAIGEEAAEKAIQKLGAKTVSTQKAYVVFDPYVATNFLGVLAPALSAEAVQKGKSIFAGKVGQQVAASAISLIDNGAMPGQTGSAPFDGEGVPTSETVLVKDGQLQGFLHNAYTARKDKTQPTGNGIRGSFKSMPEVGTTNFYIKPGQVSREDVISQVDKGLYVTEVMGMHTANPISGDFSVGAAGIWIENGKFAYPVRGVAIAGNLLDLLKNVVAVADDLRFFGGKGAPTICIGGITISGH